MKTPASILCCLALFSGLGSLQASAPMSADEYLVSPWDYEGQNIKLNVAFVRPVRFQSPLPDVIFYHAVTLTSDRKMGGEMLIAVPKSESEHFAKYYGIDPRGRSSLVLSGNLLLGHRPHPPMRKGEQGSPGPAPETTGTAETTGTGTKPARQFGKGGVWFVDYKGMNADLFRNNKDIQIPDGAEGGGGERRGPGRLWGPRANP